MRILHVTNGVEWSGGMEQIAILLTELKTKGHDSILACPPGSKLIERLSPIGIRLHEISMLQDYDLIAAWKIRNAIKTDRPDVVHTHHAIAHAVTLAALTGMKKPPLVVSRRVSFPPRRNPFSRWKYGSPRINAYTVVSQSVKETLIAGGVPAQKIHVVYSALNPERFTNIRPASEIKKELGISEENKVVGKLANYSRWKGQHVFLEAARICLEQNRKIQFLLVGKETEILLPQVQKMNLQNSIKILGFRKDVPEILSILNASVNSAVEGEGLSGAMRESLALGVPVIASDVSGNREIVRDKVTGFIVPPNNAQKLADKIMEVLTKPAPALAMAQAGRKWVLENASAEKMTADCLRLYASLT